VCDDDELVGLERRLVLENAVFWDANAVEPSAERRQAFENGAFAQRTHDPSDQRAQDHEVSDAWDEKEGGAEEHAPEGAALAKLVDQSAKTVDCGQATSALGRRNPLGLPVRQEIVETTRVVCSPRWTLAPCA
jgi:hypothetical protein